jgi:hypothetical protein
MVLGLAARAVAGSRPSIHTSTSIIAVMRVREKRIFFINESSFPFLSIRKGPPAWG